VNTHACHVHKMLEVIIDLVFKLQRRRKGTA